MDLTQWTPQIMRLVSGSQTRISVTGPRLQTPGSMRETKMVGNEIKLPSKLVIRNWLSTETIAFVTKIMINHMYFHSIECYIKSFESIRQK